MYSEDIQLINSFHEIMGHSANSVKSYRTAFNMYRVFHNMSLTRLLGEAICEQEKHIPENRLGLYDRLMDFRQYLICKYIGNTITSTLSKIKTFYKYNRITLPSTPPVNTKCITKNPCISYDDLLTKSEIRKALMIADDDVSMWIRVMISSGSSLDESVSLTNRILYDGTLQYHKKDNMEDALRVLAERDDVVCTCKLTRKKTDKPYYTFLNPETVQFIAQAKLKDCDFNLDNPLLKHSPDYVGRKFRFINDYLQLGYAGGYRRFRPHMLRKFNATHLNQGSHKEFLGMDIVDNLHGRGKGATREAYFKDNPEVLKLSYIRCMNNISLYHRYSHEMVDGEVIVCAEKL